MSPFNNTGISVLPPALAVLGVGEMAPSSDSEGNIRSFEGSCQVINPDGRISDQARLTARIITINGWVAEFNQDKPWTIDLVVPTDDAQQFMLRAPGCSSLDVAQSRGRQLLNHINAELAALTPEIIVAHWEWLLESMSSDSPSYQELLARLQNEHVETYQEEHGRLSRS